METAEFFKTSKVFIIAGKGGVGKTAVSAAMAFMCSKNKIKTTVVELDDNQGLLQYYNVKEPIGFSPTCVDQYLSLRVVTPDEALLEYLETHGFKRISKRLTSANLVEMVSTAIPGIKDILLLGKIKQLERTLMDEVIIVDAPATGHAITFLTSPKGLLASAKSGPVKDQAIDVLELLSDPKRCQVILVTIAEETPTNETIEAAFELEDKVGIRLGPVIVNALYPKVENLEKALATLDPNKDTELINAGYYYLQKYSLQMKYVKKLTDLLPLSYLFLPELFVSELSNEDIRLLANELENEIGHLYVKTSQDSDVLLARKD